MNARKTMAFALAATLAFAPLAGCGANAEDGGASTNEAVEQTEQAEQTEPGDEELDGGWTVNAEASPALTDEEAEVFAKASEGYAGVGFEPVAVLATQVVAGTNYAYLCSSTTVTAEPQTSWTVVVVYHDLEGNASITNATKINLASLKTAEADANAENLAGGWSIVEREASPLPADAQDTLEAAMEGYAGVGLNPIALLGTQVVAGTNYLVLCEGAPVVEEPVPGLYVAQVYQDLEGGAQLTDVAPLNLLEYV